jgi:Transcriptional regulator
MDAFLEELQKVRQGAIARDIGEINPQLHCYAVPVTFAGRVDCAMSVSPARLPRHAGETPTG